MAGFDVTCCTVRRAAQLESNGGVLGFDVSSMFTRVDVFPSLSVVFQRNSGPAARGFSVVHQWAAYRSGHTRHLQVNTHSHGLTLICSTLSSAVQHLFCSIPNISCQPLTQLVKVNIRTFIYFIHSMFTVIFSGKHTV